MDNPWVWITAVHVVGTVMLMGPAFGYGIIAAMGQREPQHRAFANKVIGQLNRRMFNPGLVIVIASGLSFAFIAGPALFTRGWVIASCVIIVLTLTYSWTVHRLSQNEVRQLAGAAAQGGLAPEQEDRIGTLRTRLKVGGKAIAYAYGLVVVLMVLKPF